MARAPRLIEPGGFYHVIARGNDGRDVFTGPVDRPQYLGRLGRAVERHRLLLYGYVLMTTHAHMILQVPEGGLSPAMQLLLGGYAQWWNREHGHYGHLFRNRFESSPIESPRHLVAALRYVDLNPVRAGMHPRPEDWAYSSYRAHVGLEHPAGFLAQNEFLQLLGPTPDMARKAYERFVREGHDPVSDTGFNA